MPSRSDHQRRAASQSSLTKESMRLSFGTKKILFFRNQFPTNWILLLQLPRAARNEELSMDEQETNDSSLDSFLRRENITNA
jgi:predicted NAD/FAD-binding protein